MPGVYLSINRFLPPFLHDKIPPRVTNLGSSFCVLFCFISGWVTLVSKSVIATKYMNIHYQPLLFLIIALLESRLSLFALKKKKLKN